MRPKRYWIYLFPGLVDFSLASFSFFVAVKATQLGVSPITIGGIGSVWGTTYFASSLILSKLAKKENVYRLMMTGCLLFILLTIGFALFNSLPFLFILTALTGITTALFFIGFQVFMGEQNNMPLHKGIAFYTLAWSSGIAFGSLVQGILLSWGPFISLLPVFLSFIAVIFGLKLIKRGTDKSTDFPNVGGGFIRPAGLMNQAPTVRINRGIKDINSCGFQEDPVNDRIKTAYVYVGWMSIFTATAIRMGIGFLLPNLTMTLFGFSSALAGLAIFISLMAQALAGFSMMKLPAWRYRLAPLFWTKLIVVIGCFLAAAFPAKITIFTLTILVGIYSGHAYYNGVFYALNQRDKSGRNVGINEALVGVASIVGPLTFGICLQAGVPWFMMAPAIFVLITFVAQAILLKLRLSGSIN
ncbi:MAG: MFS transporter [Candidatus Omnitrophota bacterium]